MSVPAIGHNSYLQIAVESTYGTSPATATNKFEIVSAELSPNLSTFPDPSISSVGVFPRNIVRGLQFVTGRVRVKVGFEGFEELWRALLGSYSAALVGGETLVRDHTFLESVTQKSYTSEFSLGNIPTGKVTRLQGFLVTGLAMSSAAATGESGVFNADIDFAAQDVAENTTPMTAPAGVTNLLPVEFHRMLRTSGNLKDGSGLTETSIFIRSLALRVTMPHDMQRGYLGSIWADRPVRAGMGSARVDLEYQWDANNYVLQAAPANQTPP